MNIITTCRSKLIKPARMMAALVTLLSLSSIASAVPIVPNVDDGPYSFQIVGDNYGPDGETVDLYVYDDLGNQVTTYAEILITDETSGTVYYDISGGYGYATLQGGHDFDSFLFPYGDTVDYSVTGTGMVNLIFGDTVVASGLDPSFYTSEVITAPGAASVPDGGATALLLGLGLLGAFLQAQRRLFRDSLDSTGRFEA